MMHKFFLRRLRSFFLYMLIPTLFIYAASFALFVYNIETDLRNEGVRTIQGVETNFDLVISNALYQNDLLTNTSRMTLALRRMLTRAEMSFGDSIYISTLKSTLSSIIDSHSYMDSIYLYLDGGDRYFSSSYGVVNIETGRDDSWLVNYEEMNRKQKNSVFVRQKDDGGAEGREVLTVLQRLLLQKGCVVINMDIARMQTILGTMFSNDYETVYILDDQGNILIQQGQKHTVSEQTEAFFRKNIQKNAADNASKWVVCGDEKFLMCTRKYDGMDIYIVSAISSQARMKQMMTIVPSFLLMFLLNCFVVMILAYRTTRRTFEQIGYMIQVFDNAERGILPIRNTSREKDEYGIIMNNIIAMHLNSTYLNAQLTEQRYQQEIAELTALQLQINPHFLYNTLQTLDMEVRKGTSGREDVSTIIRNVSDILKYALSSPHLPVTMTEEILYLKKYITVQKFRFGDQFLIYYEVDQEAENAGVFRLMLQPLVENSLLHGVRRINRKGYIKVKVYVRNQRLSCYVVDNGTGMSGEAVSALYKKIRSKDSQGIGLTNLNRRLCLKYGIESELHIQSKEGWGTCISFKIPYEAGIIN